MYEELAVVIDDDDDGIEIGVDVDVNDNDLLFGVAQFDGGDDVE